MSGRSMRWIGGGLLVVTLCCTWVASGQTSKYQGAAVAKAGSIAYPPNSRTPGMVTLDVSVDATGAVVKIMVARDVPPLTSAAQSAVNGWQFAPAMKGGKAVPGVVRVNVVFNPFNPGDVSIPTQPLPTPDTGGQLAGVFQPPDVQAASYAVYPVNTVASGTVSLDVKVGADGSVAGTRVLGGEGGTPLSGAATRALRGWTFVPATYQGQAVASRTVVAYVFVSPAVGTQ